MKGYAAQPQPTALQLKTLLSQSIRELAIDLAIVCEPYQTRESLGSSWMPPKRPRYGYAGPRHCSFPSQALLLGGGSVATNARGRALLEIIAPLDIALLNEGVAPFE
ncbi:GL15381 [Drosophila persimilis]|uniref:GL15381 n=1 Tax=Drosophila persimilis TaxID=7234 RepID=B4HBC1_DROPE|nr:GL15381 [Drosophila persimilis]